MNLGAHDLLLRRKGLPIVTGRRKVELKGISMQRLSILEGNPLGLPVPGAKKAHREMTALAPGGGDILLVPGLNLPEDPLPGLEGLFPLIENEVVAGTPCLARIPQVALMAGQGGLGAGCQDTVGLLGFPFPLRPEKPAQAGDLRVQTGWVYPVLTGQIRYDQILAKKREDQQDVEKEDWCSHAMEAMTPGRELGNSRFH